MALRPGWSSEGEKASGTEGGGAVGPCGDTRTLAAFSVDPHEDAPLLIEVAPPLILNTEVSMPLWCSIYLIMVS